MGTIYKGGSEKPSSLSSSHSGSTFPPFPSTPSLLVTHLQDSVMSPFNIKFVLTPKLSIDTHRTYEYNGSRVFSSQTICLMLLSAFAPGHSQGVYGLTVAPCVGTAMALTECFVLNTSGGHCQGMSLLCLSLLDQVQAVPGDWLGDSRWKQCHQAHEAAP